MLSRRSKTAALISQNRRQATVLCQGAWMTSRRNNGFFIIRFSRLVSGWYIQREKRLVLPNNLTVINFLLNVVPFFWGIFKHFHTAVFSPHIAFYQV